MVWWYPLLQQYLLAYWLPTSVCLYSLGHVSNRIPSLASSFEPRWIAWFQLWPVQNSDATYADHSRIPSVFASTPASHWRILHAAAPFAEKTVPPDELVPASTGLHWPCAFSTQCTHARTRPVGCCIHDTGLDRICSGCNGTGSVIQANGSIFRIAVRSVRSSPDTLQSQAVSWVESLRLEHLYLQKNTDSYPRFHHS